jgi:hypothetical protein
MELKDMIVTTVYLSPDGLFPLEIIEKVEQKFGIKTNTKKVLQIIKANSRLFVEEQGKIKSPPNHA